MRRLALCVLAVTVLAPAPAEAAKTIGSKLSGTAANGFNCGGDCTVALETLDPSLAAADGVRVETPGVIVRWRIKVGTASGPMRFRVVRPAAGGFVGAGSSPELTPAAGTTTVMPDRLSVAAGDRLGLRTAAVIDAYTDNGAVSDGSFMIFGVGASAALPDGGPTQSPDQTNSPYELLINADIEADADADGHGDETQDNCPAAVNPAQDDLDGDKTGDACDPDVDADGVSNADEAARGTDARRPDSDGDGLRDGADNCPAIANADQLDSDRDGAGDSCDADDDQDGLTDVLEAARRSSRLDLDSDDDGLADADEVRRGLNPARADSDVDLVPDGRELGITRPVNPVPDTTVLGTNRATFAPDRSPGTKTNPRNRDTDGDRIRDGREDLNRNGRKEANESNPLRRDTDGDGLSDAREDKNLNGAREAGETKPARRDTDRDGVSDRRDRRPLDRTKR